MKRQSQGRSWRATGDPGGGHAVRSALWLALGVFVVLLMLPSTEALASEGEAPKIRGELVEEEVLSTRAHIEAQANISNTEVLEVHWRGEIATESAFNKNEWKVVNSETTHVGGLLNMELGEKDAAAHATILHKLEANTTYYARFHVEDAYGKDEKTFTFRTSVVAAPEVAKADGFNGPITSFRECVEAPTPKSACFTAQIETNGEETEYRFEYAPSSSGPWAVFSSGGTETGKGTVSVAEDFANPEARLGGLTPESTYYVRLLVHNAVGTREQSMYTGPGGVERPSFTTPTARPVVSTPEVGNVTGVSAGVTGRIIPHDSETHWEFEYSTSANGGWIHGPEGTISQAEAEALPENTTASGIEGTLPNLKPSEVYYVKLVAENRCPAYCGEALNTFGEFVSSETKGIVSFETFGAPVAVTLVTHAVHEGSLRLLGSVDPRGYDTHFHFEYVSQRQFEEGGGAGGFAQASVSSEVDMGSGAGFQYVGEDLPGLLAGETYRYRIVATNVSPGAPLVRGGEESLSVPVAPTGGGGEESCPNEGLRVGASAALPDCRAYEQVTPVDKEGAQEVFRWANGLKIVAYAVVGEDGEHLMVQAPVSWRAGVSPGEAPYFFSRDAAHGWRTTAATIQPEAGLQEYHAEVFAPDLLQVGFEAGWDTFGAGNSPSVEYKVGAPGGPYKTVASVPRKQAAAGGWVAASEDFSKLILQVEDRKLVAPQTTTTSGPDLYEYTASGVRQVNVGIGRCGANIVKGNEESPFNEAISTVSSRHAVSDDGSRVFFEAVPGSECSATKHLYVRVNGSETVDLGAYRFAGANASGSEALLEKTSGEGQGLYLYKTGGMPTYLASTGLAEPSNFTVSQDLTAIYFNAGGRIEHYDIASKTLDFVAYAAQTEFSSHLSADGRYYYFDSGEVPGVPGGAVVPGGGHEVAHKFGAAGPTSQVYRYDSVEHAIECMSCSSSFAREPKLGSYFGGDAASSAPAGTPRLVFASDNGEFAFFQTPAALVASDIDGEVVPEGTQGAGSTAPENPENQNSVSGDVYEWRRDGSHGCAQLEGCLALLTNGRGGYLNELLGTANEGSDVFIYTSSKLVGEDNDSAGDIYDVRIDGGFPEASHPVECEGDSCSTPFAPPSDLTPSTATFQGQGNVVAPAVKAKSKAKAKAKPCKAKSKHKCKRAPKKSSKKTRRTRRGAGAGTGRRG